MFGPVSFVGTVSVTLRREFGFGYISVIGRQGPTSQMGLLQDFPVLLTSTPISIGLISLALVVRPGSGHFFERGFIPSLQTLISGRGPLTRLVLFILLSGVSPLVLLFRPGRRAIRVPVFTLTHLPLYKTLVSYTRLTEKSHVIKLSDDGDNDSQVFK